MMRRQLLTGLLMTIAMIVLVGLVFPVAMTGAAQLFMSDRADGSLVERNGQVVGSSLIGQNFTDADGNPLPQYFQSRPSAGDYDGLASGGTNLGPSNPDLIDAVTQRAERYRRLNGLDADAEVPVDAVTASGSGLDPHISVANARLQAPRVAEARGIDVKAAQKLIDEHTEGQAWGFLGGETVNVLELNLALDRLG
jgi:K+-transporting ATPase ATPase C chain